MAEHRDPSRRGLLLASGALLVAGAMAPAAFAAANRFAASPWRRLSDADWRKRLTPAEFGELRREETERPGSSPLLNEHRRGTFVCGGCGLPLFKSAWKFESGAGWPSFYRAIDGAIGTKADHLLLEERTEYHCARCLGHQGHIFHDGPAPTGLRHCNNGLGLKFIPA